MELPFLEQLAEEARISRTPVWGQFELTPICNLKCRMCYVHKPEEDRRISGRLLPASFWLETAKQAADQGMLVLSLTGGETLTYPDLDELMEGLTQMGLMLSFNTNGTLIDEKRVAWFLKYPPTKINISLYGASDATYEKLCGMKDGFTRVTRGIRLLQEAGLNVYLNAVLVPENVSELPQMHRYAASCGLVLHTTSYIFPARGCAGCAAETHRLSPELAAEATCIDRMVTAGRQAFLQGAANTSYRLAMLAQEEEWTPEPLTCRAGVCFFAVNWEGNMQPCVLFSQIQEPLAAAGFSRAWENLKARMEAVPSPQKCEACRRKEICPVCKASVYQETAAHDQAPEYLCRYTERLTEILWREGSTVAVRVPDSGDFRTGGCSD